MKHANPLFLTSWWVSGVLAALVGCGGSRPKAVPTEMVEGVVTLDGQPVPEATVTFLPVQNGVGASATGMTDSEGKYTLTAVGAGIGAQLGAGTLPGEYYVGVAKVSLPDIPAAADLGDSAESAVAAGRPQDVKVTYLVPERFRDPVSSGVKVTVKAGKNNIPIELKSK